MGSRRRGSQVVEIRLGLCDDLGAVIRHPLRSDAARTRNIRVLRIFTEILFAKDMDRTFHSEQEFVAFAAAFARELKAGDVIGLSGPLGSGKTTFVKAVVKERLGSDPVSSPTFTFWHRYGANPPIDHLDLYRVDDPSDLTELGLDDAFDGSSIVLVEWWRNAPGLLPPVHTEIEITGKGSEPRTVALRQAQDDKSGAQDDESGAQDDESGAQDDETA